MQDLLNFPPVPDRDFITLGERNGDIVHVPADRYEETKLPGYPDVSLSKDFLRVSQENSAPLFLAHEETLCKKALNAWYETGLSEALAVLNRDDRVSIVIDSVCLSFCRSPGIICSFAWHPHAIKFAYALIDDSVKVHTGGMTLVPILRTKLQKNVIDLAWQPFSSSVLAVACRSCILIWHVEPMSLAERPSASCVQILQQDHHSPVSSLGWSPSGDLLLSASPIDTAIMVWNVAMEAVVPLRRIGGGGNTMVCWSPDGFRVMSATPASVFRVWQTKTWGCDKWTLPSGRCQLPCLLCAAATSLPPFVLSLVVVIGGCIQSLVWDATGSRLALLFKESFGCKKNLIAVFRTTKSPSLKATPCGWVKGEEGDSAQFICFKPKFQDGALLTVVWSSGRISQVPFYFLVPDKISSGGPLQMAPQFGPQPDCLLFSSAMSDLD
ncbi:aladin [Octopus bimaculoides]|uniref:aladin n=1 Tax=Octopus bimaculoides TaxID=37653 RepID=UPI0022DFC4FC|nr:aladin [Octopus bimaculoides]